MFTTKQLAQGRGGRPTIKKRLSFSKMEIGSCAGDAALKNPSRK